jgi:2'-5' RNA ligase
VKKRLFIGIDISDGARKAAADHIRQISESFSHIPFRWITPGKFHITIKFLGMTDNQLINPVVEMMDSNAALTMPFNVELVGTGAFPDLSRPRVLWIGIKQLSGDMADLARRVDQRSAELGFESENREFKPHLTLARIRNPRSAAEIARKHAATRFGPISFECTELILYESHLGRDSRYDKIYRSNFSR